MKAIFVMVSLLTGQAQPGVSATSNPDKEVTPSSPLWRTLAAGSYSVGFRTMFKFDTSRTWRVTRDYTGKFTADPHGRPVQLNVWYPARSNAPGRQMTVAGYIDQTAPDEFSTLNELMLNRNRENAANSASVEQLAALRATSVMAVSEAAPEAGSFPIVLYFGGLNADINSNFILAEFLASHGYVFVSISLLGITDKQSSQARTPSDLDAVVRDMEFAFQILGEGTNADRTKLGVMGHSLGRSKQRNGNVLAVIGLEGTYGF